MLNDLEKNEKVDYQIYNVCSVGIKNHVFYAKLINPHLKHTQCPSI